MTEGGPLPGKLAAGPQQPVVVNAGVIAPAAVASAPTAVPVESAGEKPAEKPAEKSAAGQRWETAKTAVEAIKGGLLILLILGGLAFGVPFIQAQQTKAHRDETVAKAEIATREAAEKQILDIELSAQLLGATDRQRYVLVTLEVKNTGNRVLSIPAGDLEASITNVKEIDADGKIHYGEKYPLRFGVYSDSKVSKMKISPGERRKLQSVQKLYSEGLHLVKAAITLGQRADENEGFTASLFTHLY